MNDAQRSDSSDIGKLILRLTTGGLLLFHGISKVTHGIPQIVGAIEAHHLPAFFAYGVYVGEVIAPIFIILGLWTRIASLVVAFNLVVAIALFAYHHAWLITRTGAWGLESEAFYLLNALSIFFLGGGRFGLSRKTAFWR